MNRKTIIKKVWRYLKRYRIYLVFSMIFAVINVIMQLSIPIFTGDAIDQIVATGEVDFSALFEIFKKMAVAIGIAALSMWLMNVCNNKLTYSTVRDVREQAFSRLSKMPLKTIDKTGSGDIVSRIIADVDQFADGLLMGFSQFFTGIVTIVATLIFMLKVNVIIALVVVVITPLSLFVAAFIARHTYDMFKAQSEA
ncbi:MAG: ABC transporter ATP-binding protein, partial [Lachnospiraceae bacterium]|nr:ABC transporter ATP-binding protein [Lachnospiraceae bacterium]